MAGAQPPSGRAPPRPCRRASNPRRGRQWALVVCSTAPVSRSRRKPSSSSAKPRAASPSRHSAQPRHCCASPSHCGKRCRPATSTASAAIRSASAASCSEHSDVGEDDQRPGDRVGVAAGAGPREPFSGDPQRRLGIAHEAADLAEVDPADDPRVFAIDGEGRRRQAVGDGHAALQDARRPRPARPRRTASTRAPGARRRRAPGRRSPRPRRADPGPAPPSSAPPAAAGTSSRRAGGRRSAPGQPGRRSPSSVARAAQASTASDPKPWAAMSGTACARRSSASSRSRRSPGASSSSASSARREVLGRLVVRVARRAPLARAPPERYRPVGQARFGAVPSQHLRLALRRLGAQLLEGLGDARVQGAALAAQQHAVGGVAQERVPEAVGRAGRSSAPVDQPRVLEPPQRGREVVAGQVHRGGEQVVVELAPDRRAGLRDLPRGRAEPVEARVEGGVQRGRHRGRRTRARRPIIAGLEHGPGQLLGEERHAVGALDDLLDHLRRQRPRAGGGRDAPDQRGAVARTEAARRSSATCAWPAQGARNSGRCVTTSSSGSPAARATTRSSSSMRGRVGPVRVLEHPEHRPPRRQRLHPPQQRGQRALPPLPRRPGRRRDRGRPPAARAGRRRGRAPPGSGPPARAGPGAWPASPPARPRKRSRRRARAALMTGCSALSRCWGAQNQSSRSCASPRSASAARSAATRRDLPMPASPPSSTTRPSPARARRQSRSSSSSSSSRPTSGGGAAPERSASKRLSTRPSRTARQARTGRGRPFSSTSPRSAQVEQRPREPPGRPVQHHRPGLGQAPAAAPRGSASRPPRPARAPRPRPRRRPPPRDRWRSRPAPTSGPARGLQARDRLRRGEAGAHGALGVVLVRLRPAEVGQHAVAEELGDVAALLPHRLGHGAVVGGHDLAQVLRVEPGGERGRAREVAEQHREVPPLRAVAFCAVAGSGIAGRRRRGWPLPRPGAADGGGPRSAAMAASSLRRCPTAATPISFRSSAVSSGSTSASTPLSRNAASYWPRPRPRSHAATSVTGRSSAAPASSRTRPSAATRRPGRGQDRRQPPPVRDPCGHRAPPALTLRGAGMNVRAERRMRQGAARYGPRMPGGPELAVGAGPPMPRAARARGSAADFASAVSTGKRSTCEPAPTHGRAAGRRKKNNGMDLVDWIGQVPSSGEQRPSGERFPPSFRLGSIKVGAQKPAEHAPQRVRARAENGSRGTDWSGQGDSNPHPQPRRRPRPDEPFELHPGQAMPARSRRTGFRWPPGKQGSPRAVVTCVAEQARGVSGGDGAQPRPKRPGGAKAPHRSGPPWTPSRRGWCRRPDLNRGPTDYKSADRLRISLPLR